MAIPQYGHPVFKEGEVKNPPKGAIIVPKGGDFISGVQEGANIPTTGGAGGGSGYGTGGGSAPTPTPVPVKTDVQRANENLTLIKSIQDEARRRGISLETRAREVGFANLLQQEGWKPEKKEVTAPQQQQNYVQPFVTDEQGKLPSAYGYGVPITKQGEVSSKLPTWVIQSKTFEGGIQEGQVAGSIPYIEGSKNLALGIGTPRAVYQFNVASVKTGQEVYGKQKAFSDDVSQEVAKFEASPESYVGKTGVIARTTATGKQIELTEEYFKNLPSYKDVVNFDWEESFKKNVPYAQQRWEEAYPRTGKLFGERAKSLTASYVVGVEKFALGIPQLGINFIKDFGIQTFKEGEQYKAKNIELGGIAGDILSLPTAIRSKDFLEDPITYFKESVTPENIALAVPTFATILIGKKGANEIYQTERLAGASRIKAYGVSGYEILKTLSPLSIRTGIVNVKTKSFQTPVGTAKDINKVLGTIDNDLLIAGKGEQKYSITSETSYTRLKGSLFEPFEMKRIILEGKGTESVSAETLTKVSILDNDVKYLTTGERRITIEADVPVKMSKFDLGLVKQDTTILQDLTGAGNIKVGKAGIIKYSTGIKAPGSAGFKPVEFKFNKLINSEFISGEDIESIPIGKAVKLKLSGKTLRGEYGYISDEALVGGSRGEMLFKTRGIETTTRGYRTYTGKDIAPKTRIRKSISGPPSKVYGEGLDISTLIVEGKKGRTSLGEGVSLLKSPSGKKTLLTSKSITFEPSTKELSISGEKLKPKTIQKFYTASRIKAELSPSIIAEIKGLNLPERTIPPISKTMNIKGIVRTNLPTKTITITESRALSKDLGLVKPVYRTSNAERSIIKEQQNIRSILREEQKGRLKSQGASKLFTREALSELTREAQAQKMNLKLNQTLKLVPRNAFRLPRIERKIEYKTNVGRTPNIPLDLKIPFKFPSEEKLRRYKTKRGLGYEAFIIRKGKKFVLDTGLPKEAAYDVLTKELLGTLRASGGVRQSKEMMRDISGTGLFQKYKSLFRKPTERSRLNKFGEVIVQKQYKTKGLGSRLFSRGELKEIKLAKRNKMERYLQ